MRSCLVALLCCTACATAPRSEAPSAASPIAPSTATSQEELARAWAPEEVVPGAPPAITVDDSPMPADRRGPFRAALQLAVTSKSVDAARAAAADAVREAASLHGDDRERAGQAAFKVELGAGDGARATSAALQWLRACGPEACRGHALSALVQGAKLKGGASAAPTAQHLQEAESCVGPALRSLKPGAKQPRPPCLSKAPAAAKAARDEVLEAQVALVHALGEPVEAKRAALLEKVERTCSTAPGCVEVKRRALQALAQLAQEAGEVERAVTCLVKEGQLQAATLEPELRLWARPAELDALCARLDAKAAGSCRNLEKQVAGSWTFRDFSKDKAGPGLAGDQVRLVNEHYAPLLQECLAEQARRMVPPDAQRFEVRWVVHNDGRVRDAHLRRDLDATPLALCMRKQFSSWRYPRFEGEFQHVEQSFTVMATMRR
jgi:hypothetical protein